MNKKQGKRERHHNKMMKLIALRLKKRSIYAQKVVDEKN